MKTGKERREAVEMIKHVQIMESFSTGFIKLDNYLTLSRGGLYVVAARPAVGKTSLALSMVMIHGVKAEHRGEVALFSSDSREMLNLKLLSGYTRIGLKRICQGPPEITKDELGQLDEAAPLMHGFSSDSIFLQDIDSLRRALELKILDSLDMLKAVVIDSPEDMRDFSTRTAHELKRLAVETNVCIIVTLNCDENIENRPNKRPRLKDVREEYARAADAILFLYRDEVYNLDTEDKGIAEIIIAKNRQGEKDTVRVAYLGEYSSFCNLADEG